MRHIPEDELHAYLDQGLSRTQCVEIESHLADCHACRLSRDEIAALRDRTTALLTRLAPRRRVPPAFESLRRRAAEQASQRRRRVHLGAWAASLVAAVGLGWTASSMLGSRTVVTPEPAIQSPTAAAALPPVSEPTETSPKSVAAAPAAQRSPARASLAGAAARRVAAQRRAAQDSMRVEDSVRAAMLAVLDPAPAVELTQLDRSPSHGTAEFDGMWRTVSWDGARAEAGERLPHIDGLPVLKVQVQASEKGKRSVMVVAQQLASGQVIQTIEGPASDVSQLLARRAMSDVDSVILTGDSGMTTAGDRAMAIQLADDRMLAITGALPSDSLRAMIRRLNAELRSK